MTEATTANQEEEKEDGSRKTIIVLQITAILFSILSLAASVVIMLIMLLPVRDLLYGKFRGPTTALWLLFTLGLTFAIVLNALGATKQSSWKYSTYGGTTSLVLGLLCAIEIFLLTEYGETSTTSLWWLFVVLTVLGTIGVYLPERAKRLEEAEKKRKDEAARLKERRTRPRVLRLRARRYYVYENKIFVYTD